MAQGRPTTPNEIKKARGTLRADRLPQAELTAPTRLEPPQAPIDLAEQGLAFWNLAWRVTWISASTDLTLVAMTSQNIDERQQLREAILSNPDDRKLRTSLREVEKQILSNLGLLGFTPSDRSRLGVAEVQKESKLEAILRMKAERQSQNANE